MTERRRRLATLPREDLERLASAATAFCALQRVAEAQRIAMPDVHATIDGVETTITAAQQAADLDALEQAVIRTRRLLGWRR
jgi:hypothetical protein